MWIPDEAFCDSRIMVPLNFWFFPIRCGGLGWVGQVLVGFTQQILLFMLLLSLLYLKSVSKEVKVFSSFSFEKHTKLCNSKQMNL